MRHLFTPNFKGKFGFARSDITPQLGIYSRNWGAAEKDVLTKLHSPIMSHVVTIQSKGEVFILVTLDLVTFPNFDGFTAMDMLKDISEKFSTKTSNIMIHCTHTHSGPSVDKLRLKDQGGDKIPLFLTKMKSSIMQNIQTALESSQEAVMEWCAGQSPLAANRDYEDEDKMVVGFNPNSQPDQTLLIGRISDLNGQPILYLANYACHPTTLAWENEHMSSDYVGVFRKHMEDETGIPCVFLLGNCGDQAPVNQYKGDPKWAEKNGKILTFSALSLIETMSPPLKNLFYNGYKPSGADLGLWDQEDYTPNQKANASIVTNLLTVKKSLPKIDELNRKYNETTDRYMQERIRRTIGRRRLVGDDDIFNNPAWVWVLGNIIFIGLPNEAYSFLQKNIRADFPEHKVVSMNLVNGSNSYLPEKTLFKHQDAYSVWVNLFEEGSLELVYSNIKNEIQKLIGKAQTCYAQA